MMCTKKFLKRGLVLGLALLAILAWCIPAAFAVPVPGGTLNPLTIPKYVTPLVIPPVMNTTGTADDYDIAVREFQQQILPAPLPPTTVWSYGPTADGLPTGGVAPAANSQFNYPAYTIETTAGTGVRVIWRNELKPNFGADTGWLPHLLPVDQTLHWANPPGPIDSMTMEAGPYTGPVPIVTHVHGAHVDPHSDGYPEAWWLPAGLGTGGSSYITKGTLFDDQTGGNPGTGGYADYWYRQDQPATTLWYHDHTLGMTRLNVYAGPAGFWLIRGGAYDGATDGVAGGPATLPGPAPLPLTVDSTHTVLNLNTPGNAVRNSIREIPIVIQDRSFDLVTDAGGNPIEAKLFYPSSRVFFDGFAGPYIPTPVPGVNPEALSDIAPTWNPEAFFNVMVVNGVSWPVLEVAPAIYRFRLLNGCNSRFLNLALKKGGSGKHDIPFYQIGAEQGFLPQVVRVETGFATPLLGNGIDTNPNYPDCVRKNGKAVKNCANSMPAADPQQALLMGLAERADVIVDFRGLADGDIITMINTAPDAPFGGFPDIPADPATTGQVMQFVVNSALLQPSDVNTTPPANLVLISEQTLGTATGPLREVSLNEEESLTVCVSLATNVVIPGASPPDCIDPAGVITDGVPAAPKAALLGQVNAAGTAGIPLKWTATGVGVSKTVVVPGGSRTIWVTENPNVNAIENWDIYNFTVDAHPIHLHLVRFEVVSRRLIGAAVPAPGVGIQWWETGYKDTVIAYPGEITRVKAKFDIAGLYVWHCHIVEHEDNEMMRPYFVGP